MVGYLHRFERLIAWVLSILLMLEILMATVDLTVTLVKNVIIRAPYFLVDTAELFNLFGLFLVILLGLELLETAKAYLQDDTIHAEVVLIVAIIAIARKVIIMDWKATPPLVMFGLAALIVSLAASYRLIMQLLRRKYRGPQQNPTRTTTTPPGETLGRKSA